MLYIQSSIKLHPGKLQDFITVMNKLVLILKEHGWTLMGSYASTTGRLNTVLDLWEIPDVQSYLDGAGDPELLNLVPQVNAVVEDEVITLLSKLPLGS
jgi:NIPSNAP protein